MVFTSSCESSSFGFGLLAAALLEADRVMILSGAGVSCAAGIPDFRSPGGMYSTLRPELLTASESEKEKMRRDPSFVVEKRMFMANPFPYHEVRRPFILGIRDRIWKPTLFHRFVESLERRGKLLRIVTQNIDGLDTAEKVLPCHGSLGVAACESCGARVESFDEYCDQVRENIKDIYGIDEKAPGHSTQIHCKSCGNPTVKPTTVLFGSNLPSEFFACLEEELPQADLLIVAGTSLVVSPANLIAANAPCRRFLVNNELAGEHLGLSFQSEDRNGDIFVPGDVDKVFGSLMSELGWLDDLTGVDLPPDSKKTYDELVSRRKKG